DGELRGLARTVATNVARFKELIDRAREQRVHELLGFSSWTTYVADVIGKEMDQLDVDTRRDLVALLAGEGMSQRAIADAVGVNHATVSRDQATIKAEQVLHDATPDARPNTSVVDAITKITGRDGKTYPKRKEQRVPAPATIGRLMRKLRDLNRIADECLAIAEEFDFDSDEESYEQYNAVDNLAGDLQMTVERIIEAIEGQ
ncbi:MAG TPA: helix-turn-helix domain-containing protein, partial [Mycobacterium sp.]|nr:helix-turn-helix domain-containing protein [Mycobacterium sp.]